MCSTCIKLCVALVPASWALRKPFFELKVYTKIENDWMKSKYCLSRLQVRRRKIDNSELKLKTLNLFPASKAGLPKWKIFFVGVACTCWILWATSGHFLIIFCLLITQLTNVLYNFFLMAVFKPGPSYVGRDHSATYATTTSLFKGQINQN